MQALYLLALAGSSLAAALPQTSSIQLPANYNWTVENWHAGCARAGCSYNFNVTGEMVNNYPGFKFYCSGYDTGFYRDCEILDGITTSGVPYVSASLQPDDVDTTVAKMSVSLSFTDADSLITYNISGGYDATYNAFVAPVYNFTIVPKDVTAVA